MAKRFTDSDKWKDAWFSELEQEDKLLWLYLLDECNHAGIWKVNMRFLNFSIGSSYSLDRVMEVLGSRVYLIGDEYILIEKWVHFQYPNGLNVKSKPQKAVIDMLLKFNVLDRVNKGYGNTIVTSQDTDTDIDIDTDTDKDAERVWKAYPKKSDREMGIKAIKKALKTYSADELIKKVEYYARNNTEVKYQKGGGRWFRDKRYEDEVKPTPNKSALPKSLPLWKP